MLDIQARRIGAEVYISAVKPNGFSGAQSGADQKADEGPHGMGAQPTPGTQPFGPFDQRADFGVGVDVGPWSRRRCQQVSTGHLGIGEYGAQVSKEAAGNAQSMGPGRRLAMLCSVEGPFHSRLCSNGHRESLGDERRYKLV